jgi:hypothetical protein
VATQITFSDDVLNVSTASNTDASIRWHVYERVVNAPIRKRAIFVRRWTSGGGLEAEQQILDEGSLPKIVFDDVANKWVILYTLYENVFVVTFTEAEVPALQPPQVGDNVTDHERTSAIVDDGDIGGRRTMAERIASFGRLGIRKVDAYNGPTFPGSVGVVASATPGTLAVRWTLSSSTFGSTPAVDLIAGFEVYRELELISGLIPFSGSFSTVYNFDITAVSGNYYVRVLFYKGPSSTLLTDNRIPKPGDFLRGTGNDIGGVILGNILLGPGMADVGNPKLISVVDARPVTVVRSETFLRPELGESHDQVDSLAQDFLPTDDAVAAETFLRPEIGRGRRLSLSQTGLGSVIIT